MAAAQDFHAAFDLGEDDKNIRTVDPDGVALLEARNAEQQRQMATLEGWIRALEQLTK